MKKILYLLPLILFFLMPETIFAAARPNSQLGCYMVWGLTGDSFGDLDSIHITGDGNNVITDGVPNRYDLSNNDCALYISLSGTEGTFSMYVYDSDGTDATNSPQTIRPNDYSTQGNWRLAGTLAKVLTVSASTSPTIVFLDSDAPGTDKEIANVTGEYIDGGDGGENSDYYIYIWQSGSKTLIAQFDESDDQWEFSKAITISGTHYIKAPTYIELAVVNWTTDLTTGDGKFYYHVPPHLDGMDLVYVHAEVITAGTTGTTDFQIYNVTDSQDMLSTKLTIDSGETGSDEAATPAVINTTYDDVVENDLLRLDTDAVSTTAPKGLLITLGFAMP